MFSRQSLYLSSLLFSCLGGDQMKQLHLRSYSCLWLTAQFSWLFSWALVYALYVFSLLFGMTKLFKKSRDSQRTWCKIPVSLAHIMFISLCLLWLTRWLSTKYCWSPGCHPLKSDGSPGKYPLEPDGSPGDYPVVFADSPDNNLLEISGSPDSYPAQSIGFAFDFPLGLLVQMVTIL